MLFTPLLHALARASAFFLLSSAAVCFPIVLGRILWPDGLSAGAQFIFWLASGVNVGFVLFLGWRYAPVILLDAFPAIYLLGEPVGQSVLGATGNAVEALAAWCIVCRLGKFSGRFDTVRSVVALLAASVVAPVACSAVMPTYLVLTGHFAASEFWTAVGNWNLANGTAILFIAPFLMGLWNGTRWFFERRLEALAWLVIGLGAGALAFSGVFAASSMNFAFLTFPFVMLVAVRFGPEETSAALVLMMASIYYAMITQATTLQPAHAASIIWFLQAFAWVLASTGLLLAALVNERRQADQQVLRQQALVLEATLREEQARYASLRYQINPHFLFNALNSIRATLPLSQNVSREMVTSLSDYFRTTLSDPEADTAPLRDEVASVRHYLAIEQKRFGEELQVTIDIAPAVAGRRVPVFLIQPLVENAIHHGFSTSPDLLELKLTATASGRNLLIEIANSGSWKDSLSEGRTGIGLDNIRRRLNLMYGDAAHLQVTTTPGWVHATIILPLEEESQTPPLPHRR